MARKSRKQLIGKENIELASKTLSNTLVPAAIYARLSEENNGYDSDDSIDTQVKLLKEYVINHEDLKLSEVFVDNGFSGTNFSRPEFERMMEKAKHGEIKCIVVKDLSRFGRDYLETGYYIENIFPLLGIRFIAVNDNFDSFNIEDRNSLMIPIKNMVNDIYSKDLSKKRMATLEIKKNKGIMDTAFAPYGYRYIEGTIQLEPVPELIPYVRMIFSWHLLGVKDAEIARRLDLMQAPTPRKVLREKGIDAKKKVTPWDAFKVRTIMSNPVYAGAVVFGKSTKCLYKNIKKRVVNKRKDWTCYYDRHPFIICPEEYKIIDEELKAGQEEFAENKKKQEFSRVKDDIFYNILCCGECKKKLLCDFKIYDNGENKLLKYTHACNVKETGESFSLNIEQDLLKMIVMDQIKILIKSAVDKKRLLQNINKNRDKNPVSALEKRIAALSEKKRRYEFNTENMYIDFAEGLIDKEEFQMLREKNILNIQEINREIESLEIKRKETNTAVLKFIKNVDELEAFIDEIECSDEIIKRLVNKIYLYKDNKVEIIFNCDDIIQNRVVEEIINEGEWN